MSRPVILDVDTGVDDAFALMLAARHPDLDLRGVTCVGGNAAVDAVVRNSLTVLEACGRTDVPVARGAERSLLEASQRAAHVHGEDGMGDLGRPEPKMAADPRHGVELLCDLLLSAAAATDDGGRDARITLVLLAPMTNIALLLRTWPQAAAGIGEIVLMGGAAQVGNATASAEFNVWHDPEAAAIVLETAAERDIPVVMYGLDVFYDVRVRRGQAAELAAGADSGPARDLAELARRLINFQCDRFGGDDATIGDAGAVCAVIDPGGLTTQRLPVRIELSGVWSRGRTIVDRRHWAGDLEHDPHGIAPTAVDVALAVDGERYAGLWLRTLAGRD